MKPRNHGPRVYDWRPAPFGQVRKVPAAEAARWREKARPWTTADVDRLLRLVEEGHGYDVIARRLGRTRVAVEVRCKRIGACVTTTPATLSARATSRALGLPCSKTVVYWIGLGWLPARNAGRADRPLWRITWENLTAMLERRETWMAWDPARIADLALREWAKELREATGGRWLSIGEVAERYCVDGRAVNVWIHKGWLPATRYGNWWVWSGDLEGWVAPCERSRAGIPKRARRIVVGKAEIRRAA